MTNLKQLLASADAAASADAVNAEGAPAWTMRDTDRLVQLSMTGTLGPSFYASGSELTADAVKLLRRAEPRALAGAIARGRSAGFVRSFPILGLVFLSRKDPALFRETFPKVVLTGGDLGDFLDLAHQVRGIGRGVKAAVAAWIRDKATPYYAQKYRRQLADALRLCHLRGGDDPLFAWILAARGGSRRAGASRVAEAEAAHPALAARRDFIRAVEAGDEAACLRLLDADGLDLDSLSNWHDRFTPALWKAAAKRMPTMRFLKSLGKLRREDALEEETWRRKLTPEKLRAARVFPFRLYSAWAALLPPPTLPNVDLFALIRQYRKAHPEADPRECRRYVDGERMRQREETLRQRKEQAGALGGHLAATLDSYARAFDWGAFNRGSWVVAPDVSLSMRSPIGQSSNLCFADVAGMFTGFFSVGLRQVTVLPFHTEVNPYSLGREASVLDHICAIGGMTGGGTFMEAPLEKMLREDIRVDNALFITDSMEWGEGWLGHWKQYRRRNPRAKAFLLRLDSNATQPFPPAEADSLGIHQIFGWSDAVVDYMRLVLETAA